MKSIVKCMAAVAIMYVASATAAVLPRVGTGTEPNQWTRNMDGVLQAAKTTNLPILLAMINDSSSGEGCSLCMQFINNTVNTKNFADVVASYRFYMVLLNKWTPSEPAYGGVSSDYFNKYFNKYTAGDNGYPQVAIIRPDGTRYKGWSSKTSPYTATGTILYQLIAAALSDLTSSSGGGAAVTVTPTDTSSQSSTSVASGEVPKAKYALFFFNGNDDIVASAQMSVASRGKWNAKIQEGGVTKTVRGTVARQSNGSFSTGSSDLNLVYDSSTGIWSGTSSGRRVYGKAVEKANSTWRGAWNIGISSSSAAKQGGWATATVGATGRIVFSGKISNTTRISGNCESAVFPADFVSENIPRWAGHGNVRFAHGSTRAGVNVGCALFAGGTLGGSVSYGSQYFDSVDGAFWKKSAIAGLNGKTFSTVGGGNISIPVAATASKIFVDTNDYNARIRCTASKGQVAATYKLNGKTYKATGVIYNSGNAPIATGGGRLGDETFSFSIR